MTDQPSPDVTRRRIEQLMSPTALIPIVGAPCPTHFTRADGSIYDRIHPDLFHEATQ